MRKFVHGRWKMSDCKRGPASGDTTLGGEGHPYPTWTSTWALSGVAAPVPEPGHWTLLLAGMGLIGVRLRRRGSHTAPR